MVTYIIIVRKDYVMSKIDWSERDIDDVEIFGGREYSYENLPQEVDDIIEPDAKPITKWPKISFDGEQFIIRIPKQISDSLKIKKGDRAKCRAVLHAPTADEEDKLEITYPPKENPYEDD